MKRNRHLSYSSFDRMFPSQDSLPKGGLGNLIALPLWYEAIQQNNTVFIDENEQMILHQMEYLASKPKITLQQLSRLLEQFDRKDYFYDGNQMRMTFGIEDKYARTLYVTVEGMLKIEKRGLNAATVYLLRKSCSQYNAEFFKKQYRHQYIDRRKCPMILSYLEEEEHYYYLPRGCLEKLKQAMPLTEFAINDITNEGTDISVRFKGELRSEQDEAVAELLRYDIGVLKAFPAFGKTVTAIAIIARFQVSTLIIVNKDDLMKQWKERLDQFLEMPPLPDKRTHYVRHFNGSSKKLGYRIDIASIQSLANVEDIETLTQPYGLVLVDECHHIAADSAVSVIRRINARHIYGLTATTERSDGLENVIYMFLGPVRYTASEASHRASYQFRQILIPRYTSYRYLKETNQMAELYSALAKDQARNHLIVQDILKEYRNKGKIIVLSERVEHVEHLAKQLRYAADNVYAVHGNLSRKERDEILLTVQNKTENESYILLSTSQLLGEGFDLPSLKTLFLTLPISGKSRIAQYTGRIHRNYEGKDEVRVYDYVDSDIPQFHSMYFKRLKQYRIEGYLIEQNHTQYEVGHILFSSSSFQAAFQTDLSNLQSELILFSYAPSLNGFLIHQKELLELHHKGIRITCIIPDSYRNSEESQYLEGTGSNLIYYDHHHSYAILDRNTVWAFTFDLFGAIPEKDVVTRRENDSQFVLELLNTIEKAEDA